MAEMIRAAMRSEDHDGDGVPDRLLQLLDNPAFGLHKDNWKNRRRILFIITGTSWGACLLIVALALYKGMSSVDIPPNTVNLLTTIFWAMNMMASALILAYLGIAQNDTNSFRKSSVELATKMPAVTPAPSTPTYGYPNYTESAWGSTNQPNYATPSPPAPIRPEDNIGGPTSPLPVIY